MRKLTKKVISLALLIGLVIIGLWLFGDTKAENEIKNYEYTETYTSKKYRFTFNYPKEFHVSEIPTGDQDVILIQNPNKEVGAQILVSIAQEDVDLTADVIRKDLPDIEIGSPQKVEVGENRKGLSFVSDNENFGGKSREVWFIYDGNLYQISTYYEFDDFLKGLFKSWKFQ